MSHTTRPRPWDRGIVLCYTLFQLLAGLQWFGLDDTGVWLRPVWPWALLGSGLLCMLYAWRLASRDLLAASGTALMMVYLGRALVLVNGVAAGTLPVTNARAWVGLGQWLLLTASVVYIWFRVLQPTTALRRRR